MACLLPTPREAAEGEPTASGQADDKAAEKER